MEPIPQELSRAPMLPLSQLLAHVCPGPFGSLNPRPHANMEWDTSDRCSCSSSWTSCCVCDGLADLPKPYVLKVLFDSLDQLFEVGSTPCLAFCKSAVPHPTTAVIAVENSLPDTCNPHFIACTHEVAYIA
jgi:hypothetical protein